MPGTYLSNDPSSIGRVCTEEVSFELLERTHTLVGGTSLMLCNPSSVILQTVLQLQTWKQLQRV